MIFEKPWITLYKFKTVTETHSWLKGFCIKLFTVEWDIHRQGTCIFFIVDFTYVLCYLANKAVLSRKFEKSENKQFVYVKLWCLNTDRPFDFYVHVRP